MAEVILKDIEKRFDKHQALTDINLDIRDKEFVVLVGPSGCGKSTLLRIIAGLEFPSGGSIDIDGKMVNDLGPRERDIAMVFQDYALYPHLSVYENMAFGLKARKMPKKEIESTVSESAKILGLDPLMERKPRELSGGQRQRVALGRAIVRKPKVFLFDEPLSNLDAKLRGQMRAEIISLHKRLKVTSIYVTHDQVEAMAMGDRIVVMKDGVIQQADTPMKVYNHPVNRFVAQFIGSPPLNFFSGKIVSKDNSLKMHLADKSFDVPADKRDKLSKYKDSSINFGIRPTDMELKKSDDNMRLFDIGVEFTEKLGTDTYVHFQMESERYVMRAPGDADLKAEQKTDIFVDPSKIYFFEPESEKTIY